MVKIEDIELWHGDCLELMCNIPDKSVDMILCDLPYGTTKNKWDSIINLELLWRQYKRIIKQNGCIALFAQTPFDKVLGRDYDSGRWKCGLFSHIMDESIFPYICIGNGFIYCIPYNDDTKHLIGTTDMPSKYYRYWEE